MHEFTNEELDRLARGESVEVPIEAVDAEVIDRDGVRIDCDPKDAYETIRREHTARVHNGIVRRHGRCPLFFCPHPTTLVIGDHALHR